jgi:hypothetical protein
LHLERAWRQHFERQRRSGRTVADYCHDQDLAEAAFYAWRRIVAARDEESELSGPAFVPVTVVQPTPAFPPSPIDIHLAQGRRVRVRSGCDRDLLAAVLALLEERPC